MFSFSVSLLMPKTWSVFSPICTWKRETVRDFLSLPFRIESDFAFIIKIMYQLNRPWEWYSCRTEIKMVPMTERAVHLLTTLFMT